jgi:hypothetical protein
MIKICYLEINTFVGYCIGAIHYYGHLTFEDKKKNIKCKLNKQQAENLSTSDYKYKIGMTSERFETEEEIINIAKKNWKKIYPPAEILIKGRSGILDPQQCIAGNKILKDKINILWKQAEKIGGYEGDEKQMTKISDKYMKIIGWGK